MSVPLMSNASRSLRSQSAAVNVEPLPYYLESTVMLAWKEPEPGESRPVVTGRPMEALPGDPVEGSDALPGVRRRVAKQRRDVPKVGPGSAEHVEQTHKRLTLKLRTGLTSQLAQQSDMRHQRKPPKKHLDNEEKDDTYEPPRKLRVLLHPSTADKSASETSGHAKKTRKRSRNRPQPSTRRSLRAGRASFSPPPSPEESPKVSYGQEESEESDTVNTRARKQTRKTENHDTTEKPEKVDKRVKPSADTSKTITKTKIKAKSKAREALAHGENNGNDNEKEDAGVQNRLGLKPGPKPGSKRSLRPKKDATTQEEAEKDSSEEDEGNDWCSACGGTGRILCCDNCPRSFHFTCAEPPVDESHLPEVWLCRICAHQRGQDPPALPQQMFTSLGHVLDKRSPVVFALPRTLRERFEGVSTGPNGEYVEEYTRNFTENKNGGVELCFKCSKAGTENIPLATCERCGEHWHADCLPDPQWQLHLPRHWTCPLHADKAATLPRRSRRSVIQDVALPRHISNDGQIEVGSDDDTTESEVEKVVKAVPFLRVKDVDDNHVSATVTRRTPRADHTVYRLPARAIKLDFIDAVHALRSDPWRPTAARDLVTELDELATRPDPEREAVRDLMELRLQGPAVDAATARRNLELLVDAALNDSYEQTQIAAIKRLMALKGRERLLELLSN